MNVPKHIVLFPDGNRRWAKQKGKNTLEGHMQGYKNLLEFSEWCKNRGVKVLTAFGFSTENWNSTKEEVDYLMNLLEKCLVDNLSRFPTLGYYRDQVDFDYIKENNILVTDSTGWCTLI